jgi:DNA mismatch endonuclease (patch repair protein)
LSRLGVHYSANVADLPGRPDLANRRRMLAIFVNGCFWHRHPGCDQATTPTRNRWFWTEKFEANKSRDRRRTAQLRKLGYQVLVVWECEAENARLLQTRIKSFLQGQKRVKGKRSTAVKNIRGRGRE